MNELIPAGNLPVESEPCRQDIMMLLNGQGIEILGTAQMMLGNTSKLFLVYRLYGDVRRLEVSESAFDLCRQLFGHIRQVDCALIDQAVHRIASQKSITSG